MDHVIASRRDPSGSTAAWERTDQAHTINGEARLSCVALMSSSHRKEPAAAPPSDQESSSILEAARKLRHLIEPADRRKMLLLIPALTAMALVQVVGIASVMPFLALVADPDLIVTDPRLRWAYETFGFATPRSFLSFVGGASLTLLVLSNGLTALIEYVQLRFAWNLNHTLSTKMLRNYLSKPYVFFLDKNSANLATNILGDVRQTVSGFVLEGMHLISKSAVTLFILILLVAVNPLLALTTFGFIGAAYGIVFVFVKRAVSFAGRARARADKARYKAAFEALSGIKDIKLLGRERPFMERYKENSLVYSRSQARHQVIALMPKYAFETIAFGGMLVIVMVVLLRGAGLQTILPTLGLYAFASYRLLPALQTLFSSLANIRYTMSSVDELYRDLDLELPSDLADPSTVEPMPFRDHVDLTGIDFHYPETEHPVLKGFDLRIAANTTVGLVGTTGAGKTTTVDILLGLLQPNDGQLLVDGMPVTAENLRSWQRNLGYVPQFIYLADDTVAGNIAFGVPADEIDQERLERAARLAHIHEFITTELPQGYQTVVGERGVKLSGGQRQRLGIARALYHDPAVLVFDEATSALDGLTEEAIFQAVSLLGKSKTIVMIAHRISTVRACDVIYLLDKGRVIDFGTYDDLLVRNDDFRAMALGSHVAEAGEEQTALQRG